jgi:ribonuclease III
MSSKRTNVVKNKEKMKALADDLGFNTDNSFLLEHALTHSTFFEGKSHKARQKPGVDDNQRLEFLGDAVLDLVVGEYLYSNYPEAREGELSKMRAFMVCEASLAAAAEELALQEALLMGKGAEAGGDRYRPSVQSDAYEALIGAIFMAQGYQRTRDLILSQFSSKMEHLVADDYEDKKSLLQELIQSRTNHGVVYRVIDQSGPDHEPLFNTGVYCGKIFLGKGDGGSKKESEIAAAADALENKDQWWNKL